MTKIKLDPELLHAAALFNPLVFKHIVSLLPHFPWVTPVAKALFKDCKPVDSYNDLTIASVLSDVMISEEISGFIKATTEMKSITSKKEVDMLVESIFKYFKVRQVHTLVNKHSDDIDKLVSSIKDIPNHLTTDVEIVTLGLLNPKDVIEQELGGMDNIIPTNFQIIKDATPFKGYLPGQVVQWVGAPGRGKSAAMLYEVSLMAVSGFKILWLAMGDLLKYDFIARFTTVITGVEYYKVALAPDKYFTGAVKEVAENIDLITIPAGRMTSEELVNIVETSPVPYDVVVIDYDSNFKSDGENSYKEGGETYNDVTEIARPPGKKARLVFIASQPKIAFWDALQIPLEGAGESSRKQHIIDMMITMGTANADRPAGMMFLPKVRRGTPNGQVGFYMDECGRFHEIDKAQLALMRKY